MSEGLEKEAKEIRKDLDTLVTKIDLVNEKTKKDSDSEKLETLKDFYQLFFAVILGATGALLINAYVANPQNWVLLLITIVYISGASLSAVALIHFITYSLPKRKRKKNKI